MFLVVVYLRIPILLMIYIPLPPFTRSYTCIFPYPHQIQIALQSVQIEFLVFQPSALEKCINDQGMLCSRYMWQDTNRGFENSICYIDVRTVPLLSSGKTWSWSRPPFGHDLLQPRNMYFIILYFIILMYVVYMFFLQLRALGDCVHLCSTHTFCDTSSKPKGSTTNLCERIAQSKQKGLHDESRGLTFDPILKMVQTTSGLWIGAFEHRLFCEMWVFPKIGLPQNGWWK